MKSYLQKLINEQYNYNDMAIMSGSSTTLDLYRAVLKSQNILLEGLFSMERKTLKPIYTEKRNSKKYLKNRKTFISKIIMWIKEITIGIISNIITIYFLNK